MEVRLRADIGSPELAGVLRLLTSGAEVDVGKTEYDKRSRVAVFSVDRHPARMRKWLFGLMESHAPDRRTIVPSTLTIRNIVKYAVENRLSPISKKFSILLGLYLDRRRIHIGSVEESNGAECYKVDIEVDKIDIEIKDTVAVEEKGCI